jgi:hypothetical protein
VLNNPDFYLAERKYIIDQWHMKQQAQFKASSTLLNEYGNKFKNLAKQISTRPADVQVADFIGLCKMGADNWQFGAYLTWIITNDKFNQFTANSLYAKLYQFIKDNQTLLNNVITEPVKTQAQTQTDKKPKQTTSPVITTQSDKPLWIIEAFNKLSHTEQQLCIEKAEQIYATIPFKKLQFVNQDNLKYCVFARSNGNSYDLLTEFAVKQYSKIGF